LQPELLRLVEIAGIRRLAAINPDALVCAKLKLLILKKFFGVSNALSKPFDESGEYFVSGCGVSLVALRQCEIIKLVAIRFEFGKISLVKWICCGSYASR